MAIPLVFSNGFEANNLFEIQAKSLTDIAILRKFNIKIFSIIISEDLKIEMERLLTLEKNFTPDN